MTIEYKSQLCVEDPQNVAFREAVKNWASGRIDYGQLLDKYPSYLLQPPERVAKAVGSLIKKLERH